MASNDEINRTIHEFMGKCWHKLAIKSSSYYHCTVCGKHPAYSSENPDYTSSDSPRRLLEEVVAVVSARFGYHEWVGLLNDLMENDGVLLHECCEAAMLLRATAEQIATACYNVIKETP